MRNRNFESEDVYEVFSHGADNFGDVADEIINDLFGREANDACVCAVLAKEDVASIVNNIIKSPVPEECATSIDKVLYGIEAGIFSYEIVTSFSDMSLVRFFGTGLITDLSAHSNCVENVETVQRRITR